MTRWWMTFALILAWGIVLAGCKRTEDEPPPGASTLAWQAVQGTPFSVEGQPQVDTQELTVSFPPELRFAVPGSDQPAVVSELGPRTRRVHLPSSKHRGGSVHLYWAPGSRIDPRDAPAVIQIIETETKLDRPMLRRMIQSGKDVEALHGSTEQGHPYAYYRFELQPTRWLIAVRLSDGVVVMSAGGYLRPDTIPSSLQVD